MQSAALRCTAWCAALAVLAYVPPASASGEFSRAAACALPFALFAGVPRAPGAASAEAGACAREAWRSAAFWLALALAPLAAAARVDVLAGAELAPTAGTCACAAAAIVAAGWASARANGSGLHAGVWCAAVLGAPVFAAVLALAPQSVAPAWPSVCASVSPLAWLWHAARAPGAPPLDLSLLAPAGGLALVVAAARVRRRAEVPA